MVMKNREPRDKEELSALPPEAVIRLPDVLQLFPVSRSTWQNGVQSGKYPAPVRLSARGVGWKLKDILQLIEDRQEQAAA